MSTTTTLAEHVIATLRTHEAELRRAGIRRLSLFGCVATPRPTATWIYLPSWTPKPALAFLRSERWNGA